MARSRRLGIEARRLRSAFHVALASAAGATAVGSCSASSSPPAHADAGSQDATTPDAAPEHEEVADSSSELDAAAEGPLDLDSCLPSADIDGAYFPDGSDADICPVLLPCGLPPGVFVSDCQIVQGDSAIGCTVPEEAGCAGLAMWPGASGPIHADCWCAIFVPGGRSTAAARRGRRVRATGSLGAFFAHMAAEEAASVEAFRRLAEDLARLGAPRALRERAHEAMGDEVRHARVITRLARRHGAHVPRGPRLAPGRPPLEALARENATEGCVRETFGALVAHWQAMHARDPQTRRVFARIAHDETGHAALAWAISAWAEPRLSDPDRRRVASARRRALHALRTSVSVPVPGDVSLATGYPRPAQARRLLDAMALATGLEPHGTLTRASSVSGGIAVASPVASRK